MKRRPVSALLFVLLAVAVMLVVWRRAEGPPVPDGFAVIVRPERLQAVAFRLDDPARIAVEASGSVGADGGLEAFAWLLDAGTRRVVWRMTPARARRAEGTRRVQRDTLRLPAGTYELFFTPHGRQGHDGNPARRIVDRHFQWRNDANQWYAVLRTLDGGTPPVRISERDALPALPGLVWRSSREHQGVQEEAVLEVAAPAVAHVAFVSSDIGAGAVARMERLADGVVLWEAQASQARPAGGSARNRRVEADVRLLPGLYRLVARTPDDHGPGNWQANPPDDPRAWGLIVTAAASTVRPLALWTSRAPVLRLRGDRPDADLTARFEVLRPATVAVYSMGEVTSDAYDYGWLVRESSGETLWEMSEHNSAHAGGGSKNHQAQHVLTLEPGVYALRYRTDGSHHLGDFNDDAPPNEERYGAALFLLGPEGALQPLAASPATSEAPAPPTPPSPLAATTGRVNDPPAEAGALAALVRLGNNERRSTGFVLSERMPVRIYATGEFSGSTAYDAAWITDAEGTTIWRMSEASLRHAGGDDRNRYCDEVLQLRPGRYTVHFTTDGSHAYDSFGDGPPKFPDAWGVIVTRAEQ